MKFVIMTTYGSYVIESDDIEDALSNAYDNHTGYDNVVGIVRVPDE